MPVYALFNTDAGIIEVRHSKPERPTDLSSTRIWIDDDPPSFDGATHHREVVIPIPADTETVPYEIIAYTDEELAARAAQRAESARREGYGPIEDQLDMMYWDQMNGTTKWRDHITAVKEANPI